MTIDLDQASATFGESTDFTVGLEEEFSLLDPGSLELVSAFERMAEKAKSDELLAESVAGELISSEIEIRSGKGSDFNDAIARQIRRRERLFALAAREGVALGATGTHPFSPWRDQHIIDTLHYARVEQELRYVAWRNNTFSLHVHVGVNGADRAVAVCDAMRPVLPTLLAVSANSAFVEDVFSGLHSARTEIFTRMFPRCGIPDHFGDWRTYADYVAFLERMGSIVEHTQLWWSVRPHLGFGTVEMRITDAQSRADESTALAALTTACVAQAALDYDDGVRPPELPPRLIEENLWRATRYGLDGKLIDFEREMELPAPAAVEKLIDWVRPACAQLGIEQHLDALTAALANGNGAQRQWRRHQAGESSREIFAADVAETCATFGAAGAEVCGHLIETYGN
jgi:glutamate---cysteine ligase / carboxylate-amine ligase